jgi:hypothetical protein
MSVFKPAESHDDCHEVAGSQINLTQQWCYFGRISSQDYNTGVRFASVNIPKGSAILSAKVTFQSDEDDSGTVCNCTIKGEAADDPATFSTWQDFDGRVRTSATVPWNDISAWTTDTDYDSPGIKDIIQEIVNQAGWVSGNHIVIFCEDNGSDGGAIREFKSYDDSTTLCARLTVTWNEGTEFVYMGSGGLNSGGKAPVSKSKNYLPIGGFQSGGAATYAFISNGIITYSYIGSGGLSIGGIADLVKVKSFLATGGLQSGGIGTTFYSLDKSKIIPKTGYKLYPGWIMRIDSGQQNAERRGVKYLDELN